MLELPLASSVFENCTGVVKRPMHVCLVAGALRPIVVDLHSAGKALGLPFLAHADLQPAACLLMLLEASPEQEPCKGISPIGAVLQTWPDMILQLRNSGM